MRCNLITDTENTVGLATDAELLGGFLRGLGHTVTITHWMIDDPPSLTADVNFYLEKFAHWHLFSADRHVGIFNLEWFSPKWLPYLGQMTQIWAKSAAAFEWFMEQGLDAVHMTGFLTRDLYDASIGRSNRVLHLVGQSSAKNTTPILRAYWDHRDLPPLTVISKLPIDPLPPNVVGIFGEQSPDAIRHALNAHRFHLCPSEVEGWGHYITEAVACGGIVITTDASPMHEHVLPTFGRLIVPTVTKYVGGGFLPRHEIDPADVARALRELAALPLDKLDAMAERARAWSAFRNTSFTRMVASLLKGLEP